MREREYAEKRTRESETKDAKCKILNQLNEINNKIKTIGKNFKLKNLQQISLKFKKSTRCGEKKRENENISEVIRPQIFTLTLNKAKKDTQEKYATKKELKKKQGLSST